MSKYQEALKVISQYNPSKEYVDACDILKEAVEKYDESIATLKTPYQVMCLHLERLEKENKILKDGIKALLSLSMYGTSIEELLNVSFDYRKLEEQKDIIRYEKIRAMQEVVKDEEI